MEYHHPDNHSDLKMTDKSSPNDALPVISTVETTNKLKRNIDIFAMIGLSMSSELATARGDLGSSPVCNGWLAMSSTIVVGLTQGGTVVVLYGLIFTSLINVFLALTLGEMASAYPSAGGQVGHHTWRPFIAVRMDVHPGQTTSEESALVHCRLDHNF